MNHLSCVTVGLVNGSSLLAEALQISAKKLIINATIDKVLFMFKSLSLFSLRASVLVLMLIVSGCASLSMHFEKPDVKLVSVNLLPSDGLAQKLAIKLRVTNPNSATLPLVGMKYSLSLQGYDLISGVTRDIDSIPGYSDADVELSATVDWINGLRLIRALVASPGSSVRYELDAKLDPGKLLPAFHVTERGMIDLSQAE